MKVLLINPYIYDVSAYSFWSSPVGLLYMGSILRMNGMTIKLLDCLEIDRAREKNDGRAPFIKHKVQNPEAARDLQKQFKRYGLAPDIVSARLRDMDPPDLVLITCIMTYWYPGAREVADLVRTVFPRSKIVVGGIYPSLCYSHAARQMASTDLVVENSRPDVFYSFIEETFGKSLPFKPDPGLLEEMPYPCFDLYDEIRFVPLITSLGCPYRCTYCATAYLQPKMRRRSSAHVLGEIRYWHDLGTERFVLYDDSFLYRSEAYAKPLLRAISRLPFNLSLYNPNALNASMIDRETASLLREAGFREVRLGFETADPVEQAKMGGKARTTDLESAVDLLASEGFEPWNIGIYVLTGLPGQTREAAGLTVDYLARLGVRIHLAQFSPIPHTVLYEENRFSAKYTLDEPLFHNNALLPFEWEGFTEGDLNDLKRKVRDHNRCISP